MSYDTRIIFSNDAASDIEMQSARSSSRASRRRKSFEEESVYNRNSTLSNRDRQDSIRVTSRRLPDPPHESQTEEDGPDFPQPPPDVISGGGTVRRDDAGTYALLGRDDQTTLLIDPDVTVMESPYAEGRGILGPIESLPPSDHETGEPVEETNVVYSTINQEEKQKSRKLKEERLSLAIRPQDGIRGKVD